MIEYNILTANTPGGLAARVNESLNFGWELYGDLVSRGEGYICQVVIRTVDATTT